MKSFKRRLRKIRNRIARRLFDTRYGRELLVQGISPRVLSMTADCGDHRMTFSPHDYIGRKIYRKGHFERDHVDRLMAVLEARGLLRPETVLLELGGNIGTQTLYFALTGRFRQIVTVEPDPRNLAFLETNIRQNGFEGRIRVAPCAAGAEGGTLDFFQHAGNSGKSSALAAGGGTTRIAVPVKTVPEILTEAQVSVDAVGLVWMDIEGYEPAAIAAMEPLLARRTPIYLEFSPVFYGPAGAAALRDKLARHYENGLIFREDGRQEPVTIRALPVDEPQFDVLLLP
ncbi:methyltransferase [Rhizobium rhizosphaerae]|uniref:Methyltransferase n=1 Tax=Xaviernesmea rhizosphaerae TaxID=1672749 RepID=A0A1Q9AC84_9HYPH|nr:FkbM family methyltransferase [Xaviernesmea rhizosphaerae]OLP52497.1 methyltransferase [Xaviernesmea rhizosphaerae]